MVIAPTESGWAKSPLRSEGKLPTKKVGKQGQNHIDHVFFGLPLPLLTSNALARADSCRAPPQLSFEPQLGEILESLTFRVFKSLQYMEPTCLGVFTAGAFWLSW